jgi:predicted Zn-dependent protease
VGHPHYALAYSRVLLEQGGDERALDVVAAIEPRFPSYPSVNLAYAEALIANERAGEARSYLMGKRDLVDRNADANRLLARAAEKNGRLPEAHYREARYFFLRGNHAAAIHRLQAALELPDLGKDVEARPQVTLRDYRQDCNDKLSERECRDRVEGTSRRPRPN